MTRESTAEAGCPSDIPGSLLEAIGCARRVVVLTGAGVSAPSGIPTFRDALKGVWATLDPTQLATPHAFATDPERVTRWYDQRRLQALACRPNPAHTAMAQLERKLADIGCHFTLLTQNVDRLHQRSGSCHVHELHGSLMTWRCTKTGRERDYLEPKPFDRYPPLSAQGGLLRPAVVWFGESLSPAVLGAAGQAVTEGCDLFISVGTSNVVYPAASLIESARAHGARTCVINLDATGVTQQADWSILGRCERVLPILVAGVLPEISHRQERL